MCEGRDGRQMGDEMRKQTVGIVTLLLCVGLLSHGREAHAANTSKREIRKITAGIQKFYQNIKTLCTNFRQYYKPKRFTRTQKARGQFFFKRPGKLRFYYRKPEVKHYIYNGTLQKLWMHYPEDQEVKVRKGVSKAQFGVAVQFLWGGGKLHKTFRIKKERRLRFGRKGDIRLRLIPKKPQNLFKKLYFAVVPGTYRIRETIYVDPAGNRNRFIFYGMKTNRKCRLKNRYFRFKAPRGTQVIELK
jgi:outer membrane lipoprotein-sorting protein